MPAIRPSADLRNKYNEISEYCHKYTEAVFITKNGKGDLAVMSIETFELLTGRKELYQLIDEGLEAADSENTRSMDEVFSAVRKKINL